MILSLSLYIYIYIYIHTHTYTCTDFPTALRQTMKHIPEPAADGLGRRS